MSLFDMQCGNAWLQWYYQAKVCQNNKYNLSVILSEILSPSLPKNSNQNTLCMWNSFVPIFTWKRNKYFYYFLSLCYLLCDLLILISLSLSIFHCKRTGTWWDILIAAMWTNHIWSCRPCAVLAGTAILMSRMNVKVRNVTLFNKSLNT